MHLIFWCLWYSFDLCCSFLETLSFVLTWINFFNGCQDSDFLFFFLDFHLLIITVTLSAISTILFLGPLKRDHLLLEICWKFQNFSWFSEVILLKVDKCMARLQELQYTVAGGNKVISGVTLSPRSTRGYLRTSLRCKQESLRIKNATSRKSPPGKLPTNGGKCLSFI